MSLWEALEQNPTLPNDHNWRKMLLDRKFMSENESPNPFQYYHTVKRPNQIPTGKNIFHTNPHHIWVSLVERDKAQAVFFKTEPQAWSFFKLLDLDQSLGDPRRVT